MNQDYIIKIIVLFSMAFVAATILTAMLIKAHSPFLMQGIIIFILLGMVGSYTSIALIIASRNKR